MLDGAEERRVGREGEAVSLEKVKREGMQVNEISPAEQDRMRAQAQSVHQRHAATIGQDVIDAIQAELRKARGQ